jgi:hypothetical protein
MDARRLGMGIGLPQVFLEAAAPRYLTGAEWDAEGDDWLAQALAYTAVPCKGVRGPLTRIRPHPDSLVRPDPAPGTLMSSCSTAPSTGWRIISISTGATTGRARSRRTDFGWQRQTMPRPGG